MILKLTFDGTGCVLRGETNPKLVPRVNLRNDSALLRGSVMTRYVAHFNNRTANNDQTSKLGTLYESCKHYINDRCCSTVVDLG